MRKWVQGFGLLLVCACGDEPPPPTGSNLPTTSVAPSSTTSSSPTSSTSPPSNHPPSVRVTGDDGCHPVKYGDVVHPCAVSFEAEGSDPDGDSLKFRWSGCASGSELTATCTIDRLGPITATVQVSDGRGGTAKASKVATGTNQSPEPGSFGCGYRPFSNPGAPDCGREFCPVPLPTNGFGHCMDGNFTSFDAEGDYVFCGPITASGACSSIIGIYECGGAGDAYSFEFRTGPDAGECVLFIGRYDSWGASASKTVRLPVVQPPF